MWGVCEVSVRSECGECVECWESVRKCGRGD